jgi:hypothetical protein
VTNTADGPDGPLPQDLGYAGSVVDKAIEYMTGQNISSIAIASALLGGALGMLARSVSEDQVIGILNNAIASVRNGELRPMADPPAPPA